MIRDTKYFRFGPTRQERGSKHVRHGDLLTAINVQQTDKAGVYAKRDGFTRVAKTYSGGSLSGTPVCVTEAEYGTSLMRDSGGQLWASSSSGTEWLYRGQRKTLWPSHKTVLALRYASPMPFSCVVGTKVWVFGIGSSAYNLTIINTTTGAVETPPVSVAATNIVTASAVYDGTNVWVFWVDGGSNGTIRAHKFVVATPTVAPTATDYYTFPANASDPTIGGSYNLTTLALQHVRATYLSSSAKVFVVACGGRYSAPNYYRGAVANYYRGAVATYLNAATGTAATSGVMLAYVGTTGGGHTVGPPCIPEGQDGSDTYLYVCLGGYCRSTDFTSAYNLQKKIATSNLAAVAVAVIENFGVGTWITAGCVDGGNQCYLFTYQTTTTYLGVTQTSYVTTMGHVTGTTVTTKALTAYPYKDWVASGLVKYGSDWYCLTGFDDYACSSVSFGAEATSTQRMFHVAKLTVGASATASTVTLEAQVDPGLAAAIHHKSTAVMTIPTAAPIPGCLPPMHLIGTSFYSPVGVRSGVTGYVDVALMTVETSKTVSQDAAFSGMGVVGGNIPMVWSLTQTAHEIAPLSAPPSIGIGATGSDYNVAAVVYAIYDSDGKVWRSAPNVVATTFGATSTLRVFVPMHSLPNTVVNVEIYIGNAGIAKLQTVITPAAGATEILYTAPALASMIDGEALYTTGGAMSNTWPVACQAVGAWRNRVFLANDETVWFSKEIEDGFGPLFNEVMRTYWSDADSNIAGMSGIDSNYFALVAANSVGVISGPGPDGLGNGNYVVQTLSAKEGLTIGYPLRKGPSGAYFQDANTGRIHCITPSLGVAECAPGAYDYSAYVVTSITWNDRRNQMIFWARASQAAIVLDYNHPDETAPFGISTIWTFDATLGCYGASVDETSLFFVDLGGHVHRQSAAQWVDSLAVGSATYQMKISTAELQMGDLQGQFTLEALQVLLTMRGVSGISVKVYPGYASRTGVDSRTTTSPSSPLVLPAPTNSGDTESVLVRPANCARIQSFGVEIIEAPSITSQSFEFEGLAAEYTAIGRMLRPAETRIL